MALPELVWDFGSEFILASDSKYRFRQEELQAVSERLSENSNLSVLGIQLEFDHGVRMDTIFGALRWSSIRAEGLGFVAFEGLRKIVFPSHCQRWPDWNEVRLVSIAPNLEKAVYPAYLQWCEDLKKLTSLRIKVGSLLKDPDYIETQQAEETLLRLLSLHLMRENHRMKRWLCDEWNVSQPLPEIIRTLIPTLRSLTIGPHWWHQARDVFDGLLDVPLEKLCLTCVRHSDVRTFEDLPCLIHLRVLKLGGNCCRFHSFSTRDIVLDLLDLDQDQKSSGRNRFSVEDKTTQCRLLPLYGLRMTRVGVSRKLFEDSCEMERSVKKSSPQAELPTLLSSRMASLERMSIRFLFGDFFDGRDAAIGRVLSIASQRCESSRRFPKISLRIEELTIEIAGGGMQIEFHILVWDENRSAYQYQNYGGKLGTVKVVLGFFKESARTVRLLAPPTNEVGGSQQFVFVEAMSGILECHPASYGSGRVVWCVNRTTYVDEDDRVS